MQWPLDVPTEFSDAVTAKTPEELLKKLISFSDENLIRFFEWISHDEIWSAKNIVYLKVIFKWINQEFLSKRLSLSHAKRVAASIHMHFDVLKNCLFYDVIFDVEGKKAEANSLMVGASSEILLDLLRRNKKNSEEKINIKLLNKPKNTYWTVVQILEFIHTDHIFKLPQFSFEELFAILHKAIQWDLPKLIENSSTMLKKYVTPDNALEILLESRQERLGGLEEMAIEQLNKLHSGIVFHDKGPEHLAIEIVRINEETEIFVSKLAKFVTYFICRQPSHDYIPLIKRFVSLKGVDLSFSEDCSPEFIEALPNIEILELVQCPWLNIPYIQMFLKQTPQLKKLNLSENNQIEHHFFTEVVHFQELISLRLLNCPSIDDEIMLRLGAMSQELREFCVSGAQKISEYGLMNFTIHAHHLNTLVVADCSKITERGFVEMGMRATRLVNLDLHKCKNVTDHALLQIARTCPALHSLNIQDCPAVTAAGIEKIKQTYPYINITL